MKSLTLTLLLGIFTLNSNASATCLAMMVDDIGYGSAKWYNVMCGTETFDTKQIVTGFLLPLPYNWGKVARTKLLKEMSDRSYQQVAVIHEPKLAYKQSLRDVYVFEKEPSTSAYCMALKQNKKISGINHDERFDVTIKCSDGLQNDLSLVTVTELDAELAKGQYAKVFDSALPEKLGNNFNGVTVYKK